MIKGRMLGHKKSRTHAGTAFQKDVELQGTSLLAVRTNGFHRATGHSFLAEALLFIVLRLLVHVAVATVVVAGEVGRGGFAAKVTVNALVVHVELARGILRILIFDVCHFSRVGKSWIAG
jgi:hypothetical protein